MKQFVFAFVLLVGFMASPAAAQGATQDQDRGKNNINQILVNEAIPAKVRNVLRDSIVNVTVFRPVNLSGKYNLEGEHVLGTGFVVGDHRVITNYHVAANEYVGGNYLDKEALILVFDGETFYNCKQKAASQEADLILLEVFDAKEKKFGKKPLNISEESLLTAPRSPWFAFGFSEDNLVLVKEFRYFSGYIHANDPPLDVEVGNLDQAVEMGFSGAPLLDQDGECRGVVEGTRRATHQFISGREILYFLSAAEKLLVKPKP